MPSRPPRVAQILPFQGVGGTEHATLRVARAAAEHGFESVAFCLPDAPAVRSFFADAGVQTATWHARHARPGERLGFVRRSAQLAHELRRRRIALVHCADLAAASWSAAPAGRLAGLPVVCHIRNRHAGIEPANVLGLRLVHRFAFVSHDSWRSFGFHVPPDRGQVIYDGVAAPPEIGGEEREHDRRTVRQEFGLPADARVVGMVARVEPQKDFATLARAAARVVAAEPRTRFLVVGGTSHTAEQRAFYPEVRRALQAEGVAPHFVFTDQRTDVDRLLRAMDVFVLCTHWEGLPLVLIEAMAQGLPVVATAVDGVPEVVQDGTTGLLVGHEDAAQLAAQLLAVLGDDARARAMSRAAREYVTRRFGHERFAAEIGSLYQRMTGAQTATPRAAHGARPEEDGPRHSAR